MLANRAAAKAASRPMMARALVQAPANHFSSEDGSSAKPQLTMVEEESKHRMKLPLYDLYPRLDNIWVAPNSTVGKSWIMEGLHCRMHEC